MTFMWKNKIFAMFLITVLFITLCFTGIGSQKAYASHQADDTLGATPPMGYSTWNAVRFNVSDALIRKVADSMVSTGLRDLGYLYVNIDDGWQGGRDAKGKMYADSTRFPNGMKALADYVHSKGLKIGIYTDIGRVGCGGRVGSYGYYQQDVNQFAEWGFDYIKVDACGADSMGLDFKTQYKEFSDALKNANPARDILFNICEWGKQQPWKWAPEIGNTWRTGYDIDNQGDYWKGVLYEVDQTVPHADVAGPGHFNDPDSLEVGVVSDKNGIKGLNYDESVANFSMWAVLAAPLMLGLDVTQLDTPNSYSSGFADIVKNAEVIAVDQDPAGIQGKKVDESTSGLQVYSKPLGSSTSGERAVVLLNRSNAPARMTVTSEQIGLLNTIKVRDLWRHEDMGTHAYSYSATVPAHGSVMLKIKGTYNPEIPAEIPTVAYEAEASTNTLSGTAKLRSVPEASGGSVVGYVGNGIANALQFNNISAPSTGSYQLSINYISGDARNTELDVNGIHFTNLSLSSSGGWSSVRTSMINVDLNKGMNTLKFSNSGVNAFSPDFDKIEISAIPIAKEIAQGKPAVADNEDAAFPASNGNDGNISTKWSASDTGIGHTWTVDLGNKHLMKSSSVSFENSNKVYQYKIEVKDTGSENWTTAVDRTNNTEAGAVLKDSLNSVGRYARITVTGLPNATKASIWDFKLFGESLDEDMEEDNATQLIGADKVSAGEEFDVRLALSHLTKDAYAQDITLSYDANVMDFITAGSLVNGVEIIDSTTQTLGKVRLILASTGTDHAVTGDVQLLKLNFKAKMLTDTATGKIEVTSGVLADENGVEIEATPSSISIEVTAKDQGIQVDINGDGKISIGDLAIVAANYGKDSTSPDWNKIKHMDLDGSGTIDIADLSRVAKKIIE
ncbi:cohesin domain-containing protein [Paenibacillus macquariensis]|uniref:Alpha-galactosidase n=1 Tax=Paenibacillus macquariensis TaxID=948756 RepID=A0ABY1JJC1_9BACL|nr:cohesin domain-containing protein [Paenibacillus macquariensis]MEC0089692.1 cohesin domain-containing protein [Paenibacillus macquariensis]OAB30829.1 hypothetical protein PMSM_22085 [Paenibacillus macquariensis subsp. macquariensis]SIQ28931.1 Cohesin domain-containing protein [Paenibacillus macquariensis]